jgi:hypothetical protein
MDKKADMGKNSPLQDQKETDLIRKLRLSASITTILGFLSVIAMIFLYLALADIAHLEEDLSLEWHVAGVCIIILSTFTISTFVTLSLLFKTYGYKDGKP